MVKLKKTIGLIVFALVAAVLITGCKSSGGGNAVVTRPEIIALTVTPNPVSVIEGYGVTFIATCTRGADNSTFDCTSNANVTWTATGNLTPTATKGAYVTGSFASGATAKVTAAYGNLAGGSANVTILKITRLEILPSSLSIMAGYSATMTAWCHTDEGPSVLCTDRCDWTSEAGLELTTLPSTFLANGEAPLSKIIATHKPGIAMVGLNASIAVIIGSGQVIAIKIDPEVGLVQGEQKWFHVTCTNSVLATFDCTHGPNTTYNGGGDMIPCNPLITSAPSNNCWQMDYLTYSGACSQNTCAPAPLVPQQNSYVQATYVNPPEFGGISFNDQAEIHCRYLCDIALTPDGVVETETTQVDALCTYTDRFNDACSLRYLNYTNETTPRTPFVTWSVMAGVFADVIQPTPNSLIITAHHIPGPCGAVVQAVATYYDDDLFVLMPKPFPFANDIPIKNDDVLIAVDNIIPHNVWEDDFIEFDADCHYDLAGSLDPDPIGVFYCSDVRGLTDGVLGPDAIENDHRIANHGIYTYDTENPFDPVYGWLFSGDPTGDFYCSDGAHADWAWYYDSATCPIPGLCDAHPPQNQAYSNWLDWNSSIGNGKAGPVTGSDVGNARLHFRDQTIGIFPIYSEWQAINIYGGLFVYDPTWDESGSMPFNDNWVTLYCTPGVNRPDNQWVKATCQDGSDPTQWYPFEPLTLMPTGVWDDNCATRPDMVAWPLTVKGIWWFDNGAADGVWRPDPANYPNQWRLDPLGPYCAGAPVFCDDTTWVYLQESVHGFGDYFYVRVCP